MLLRDPHALMAQENRNSLDWDTRHQLDNEYVAKPVRDGIAQPLRNAGEIEDFL